MKNNQIAMIVVISLVVAVIASIATASITSNVIKVNQNRHGNYKVYTTSETYNKEEVDTLLKKNVFPVAYAKMDTRSLTQIGQGFEVRAKCPDETRAISGSCTTNFGKVIASTPTFVDSYNVAVYPLENEPLTTINAWSCNIEADTEKALAPTALVGWAYVVCI